MEKDKETSKRTSRKKIAAGKEEKEVKVIDKISVSSLDGKFLLVKVGSNDKPAEEKQITDVSEKLLKLFEENNINCVTFVTHHCVDITIVG